MGLAVQTLRNLGIDRVLRERCVEFRDCGDVALPPLTKDNGPPKIRNSEYFLKSTDAIFDASSGIREQGMSFLEENAAWWLAAPQASNNSSLANQGYCGLMRMEISTPQKPLHQDSSEACL
jgi:hypothetical protein